MLSAIRTDLQRAAGAGAGPLRGVQVLRLVLNAPGVQAVLVFRLGRWLRRAWRRPAAWLPAVLSAPAYLLLRTWVRLSADIHLDAGADIGPGLLIYHFGGVRVHAGCRLGSRCVVHQEVVIAAGPDGAAPHLGDRVWIGPHARILGGVRVGDGATIGAGVVVTEDVAARTIVLGRPARVGRVEYDNSELLDSV